MNRKIPKSKNPELLVYGMIWLLVFSVPFFNERSSGNINWDDLFRNWFRLLGYLLIFLVNVYILVPRLLLEKRYKSYFFWASVVIFSLIVLPFLFRGIPPPDSVIPNHGPPGKPPILVFADNLIISILLIGSGTTIKLMSKWLNEEQLRKDAEKEQVKMNLALLKQQVSPHFFMNTLNNIHALIEMNSEKAQDAVVRLSTLMRYLLYDSAHGNIGLKKEIEFIQSFILLMQIRHSEEVEIRLKVPDPAPEIEIPPMLFISLLENAFKHGVRYPLKSYIYFELQVRANSLLCIVKNSRHKTQKPDLDSYAGIGLENLKKSLSLLYQQNFSLEIAEKENEFEVQLTIPV